MWHKDLPKSEVLSAVWLQLEPVHSGGIDMNSGYRIVRSIVGGFLLFFVGFIIMSANAAENDGRGRIYGAVKMSDGEPVANLELALRIFQANQITSEQITRSNADGTFSFQSLDRGRGTGYGIYAVYQEAEYYSPFFSFDEQTQEIPFDLIVYNATTSDQHIAVETHQVFVESTEDGLQIVERIRLDNSENTVYIGSEEIQNGKKETLRISLPFGAKNLQLGRGLTDFYTFMTDDGFVDTMAIQPGEKLIEFTYNLDTQTTGIELGRTLHISTRTFEVFILDTAQLQAESATLQNAGMFEEQGQQYLHFAGQQFGKRSYIDVTLHNISRRNNRSPKFFIPVIALILPGLWVLYTVLRQRRSTEEPELEDDDLKRIGRLLEERRQLLWAMAELDERFEMGEIPSEKHQRQRPELKKQAVELTKTLQHMSETNNNG
jgi:hypothetical protein